MIAHDAKKKLIQNFCAAYKGIFGEGISCATGTTGRLIEEAANLNIHKYLTSHLGGMQQMATQIEHNEMDLVIFLRDPSNPRSHEPDINNMVRLCDIYNIPLATSLASMELLTEVLDKGDMERWEVVR